MRSVHSACPVTCGVDGCKLKFSKPSVWYWHIRRHHFAVYNLDNRKRTYSESVGRPESHDSEGILSYCIFAMLICTKPSFCNHNALYILYVYRYSQVTILGNCYQAGMCYLMIGSECENGVTQPVFGLLQDFLHRENSPESDIIFVCQPKRTVLFYTHFAAYQIECIPNAYQLG